MKGQRERMTRTERNERTERNVRRGRHRVSTQARRREPVLLYRYRGLLVRVVGARLEVVRVWNPTLRTYLPADPPKGTAKLPIRHRRRIRKEADELARRKRVEELGVELPGKDVWSPPTIAPEAKK